MAPKPNAPDRIRVAATQYPIERKVSLDALEAKIAEWVARAAARRADLVVFPEYGLMEIAGTCSDDVAGSLEASLEAVAHLRPRIDAHYARLAREHKIHILGASGPSRRDDGSIANVASLCAPSGKIGAQEKIIMTPFERCWGITGGGEPLVFETALGRIGVLICYDSEFPLLGNTMTSAGARLLLVPSCTERVSGYNRVRTGALARALEGTVAAVQSPTVGKAPWSPAVDVNTGAAGLYVPAEAGVSETGVLVQGPMNEPHLVVGEIDFARLEQLKSDGEMHNAADWRLQPGAKGPRAKPRATMVDLT